MKKRIALGIVTLWVLAVVIGGCATGNGSGPDLSGSDTSNTDAVAAHWQEIHYGMSKDEVTALIGTPDDSQHMESQGYSSDCIYYGSLSLTSYQFCFENGSLDSKNQY
jgi:predicted small secreted protein